MSELEAGAAAVREPWAERVLRIRSTGRSARAEAAMSLAVSAALTSRMIVWAAGLTSLGLFGREASALAAYDPGRATAPFAASWMNFLLAPTARWDSVWYLQIAHDGYFSQMSSAYFPLYPMLVRLGTYVFRSELVVGALISIVSMLLAFYLLHRLLSLDMSAQTTRLTVLLIAFFPTSLFLSAVYSEALFLMFSIGAIYACRLDRWAIAGVLGGLAAASRSNGFLVFVPLAVLYLYGPRVLPVRSQAVPWWRPRYRLSPTALWLLLVPVGLLAYMAYLWISHDAPFAPFQTLVLFRRSFAGPLGAVVHLATGLPHDVSRIVSGGRLLYLPGDPLSLNLHDLIDVGFLVFAVLGMIWSWRRVPMAYWLYALAMLTQSLSYPFAPEPLASFSRYLLVIFPVFMGWAIKLERRQWTSGLVLTASALILVGFSGLWTHWGWVG